MRILSLIAGLALLLALPRPATCLTLTEDYSDHEVDVHYISHLGYGETVALVDYFLLRHSGMSSLRICLISIGMAVGSTAFYEFLLSPKTLDRQVNRIGTAGAGAAAVGFSINWWATRR